MVNHAEFICAVGSMRIAQKEYLKTRDKKSLYRAWDCERAVDNMLAEMLNPPSSANENNTPDGSPELLNRTDEESSPGKDPNAPF